MGGSSMFEVVPTFGFIFCLYKCLSNLGLHALVYRIIEYTITFILQFTICTAI